MVIHMLSDMAYVCMVLCACVVLFAGGTAVASENIDQSSYPDPRISDNILEDASLDVTLQFYLGGLAQGRVTTFNAALAGLTVQNFKYVMRRQERVNQKPGLIRKYGYPLEEHWVTTPDGYILGVQRIPHGRDANNQPGDRPVAFLMHGLFSSSSDYILMGPGSALGYILAEEGYDVWMGNARGNYYSRRHLTMNPDAILNTNFWEFSWDEIGNIDLPAMIDHVLFRTGKSKLHYVGFSQGTTVFFVMGSLRPEYNSKIISMQALAPVAYMANNENLLLRAISPFSRDIEALASLIGIGELLPNSQLMSWAGQKLCIDEAITQAICSNILFLVAGWNEDQHNATMLPVKLAHTPAGSSVRQLAHYGQGISGKQFERYDHGWIKNRRIYGSSSPPRYTLSRLTAPVFLHYSESDPLAHVDDVDRLFRELGAPIGKFKVQQKTFSHLDFTWGIDAKTLVYNRMISFMRAMDT